MKHAISLIYSVILLVGDFLALIGAFSLAFILRVKLDDRPLLEPITAEGYIAVVAVLLVFWVIIYALLGLYRPHVYDNRFKELLMLFVGSFIGILFLIGAEYALNRAIFPARLVTVYGFVLAFLLTLLVRTLARGTRRTLFRFNIGVTRILLVGATEATKELSINFRDPRHGFRVIGIVGDRRWKPDELLDVTRFANFSEATRSLAPEDIHNIVQTELFADQDRNDEILTYAQQNHIAYRFVPGNNRLFTGNLEVSLFEGIPTIAVHQTALVGWGRVAKRVTDLLVGGLLLILASPLLFILWFALTVFGGGDAVYKQARLSRYNTKIGLYKFRTHRHGFHGLTPEQAFAKMGKPELAKKYRENGDFLENDPRVSRLGRFLRKSSLDELPQLVNVVKGDISLVGPRPLIPEELDSYARKNVILSVKPGITGLAVISGRKNIPFEERRKLDMYYAQHWSFLLDIVIILKTAVQVVSRTFSRKVD